MSKGKVGPAEAPTTIANKPEQQPADNTTTLSFIDSVLPWGDCETIAGVAESREESSDWGWLYPVACSL